MSKCARWITALSSCSHLLEDEATEFELAVVSPSFLSSSASCPVLALKCLAHMESWDIQGGPRRLLGCGLESPTNPLEFNDGRPCKWWWSPGGLTQVRRGRACDPHQAKNPTGWGRVCVCVCMCGVDLSVCVCVCTPMSGAKWPVTWGMQTFWSQPWKHRQTELFSGWK